MRRGGIADLSYPHSTTRRGRVQEHGMVCPTITTQGELARMVINENLEVEAYRLTPREAWRLMGFSDSDYEKAEKAMNGKQSALYKQAGNSIVVNVLEEIFKAMM